MNTPWNESQHIESWLDNRVVFVSTASHGGLRVDWQWALENLSEPAREIGIRWHDCIWYEEDCDWAIVAFEFPEFIPEEHKDIALKTVQAWHKPYLLERGLGNLIDRESLQKQINRYEKDRNDGAYFQKRYDELIDIQNQLGAE